MIECVNCFKFNYCEKSVNEWRKVKQYIPGNSPEDACQRTDWMRITFMNCKEFNYD